ncbi:unnamed protein product, partial [Musa hybrid cultivar]
GQIGSRKNRRSIPKGVIHVQVSFNNTIVIVIGIRGRVVSWASTNTSEFKETRREDTLCYSSSSIKCYLYSC